MKVPDPPGSGKGSANGKGVTVKWGLKEAGGKPLACESCTHTMDICNSYLKTLAGYSFKTVEQNVCGVRHFLRFLHSSGKISADYAEKIHMPSISKSARIPSA